VNGFFFFCLQNVAYNFFCHVSGFNTNKRKKPPTIKDARV